MGWFPVRRQLAPPGCLIASRYVNQAGYPGYPQAFSVFTRMKESLASLGVAFGDIVSMTAYLVAIPRRAERWTSPGSWPHTPQYLGTKELSNLPARTTVLWSQVSRRLACSSKAK
jgi:hypothetical protein